MANKDDYTYPDDVVTPEEYPEAAESKQTENLQSMLMNRKIMVPAGIVGAVFLINILFGDDDPKPVAEAPAPVVADVAPTAPTAQSEEDDQQISRNSQMLTENTKALGNVVEMHNQQTQAFNQSKQQIDTLAAKVGDLSTDVTILYNELRNYNRSLASLSAKVDAMAKPKPKPVIAKKAPVVLQNFSIRAVIDGRAWIRNDKDAANTLSISVGDTVPTYGKVVAIHPIEGVIKTSSGRLIQFPADER